MIKFVPQLLMTLSEIPGKNVIIAHNTQCNLDCYGCFNYKEIIAKKHPLFYTSEALLARIQQNTELIDGIIFSGGEFLMESLGDIKSLLASLRKFFSGFVIVYTNGFYPDKLKALLRAKLIDGVHLDFKIPFFDFDPEEHGYIYELALGRRITNEERARALESLDVVLKHNSPLSQVRTVNYEFADTGYTRLIEAYVEDRKEALQSQVQYKINPYIEQ